MFRSLCANQLSFAAAPATRPWSDLPRLTQKARSAIGSVSEYVVVFAAAAAGLISASAVVLMALANAF